MILMKLATLCNFMKLATLCNFMKLETLCNFMKLPTLCNFMTRFFAFLFNPIKTELNPICWYY